ncbi:unnamed protein product [Taenia asiatica]|uniref:Protein kinase domain-containing protein n=1 Tax=Taenia asiatica TaxID=60517 RepID=A0A0R3W0H1_TAEAS|nr:unnamed protein product [Taenia asiatica]
MNAQQALLHPYFASLDKMSLPAVGEEYVGLPIGRIPPDFAELFNALISVGKSDLEGEDEDWMEEAEKILGRMPKVVPSTMLLGASTYQVSAARDKFE